MTARMLELDGQPIGPEYGRAAWLTARQDYVTASDAHIVVTGETAWPGRDYERSIVDVWREKREKPPVREDWSEAAAIGHELEPVVAKLAAERLGWEAPPPPVEGMWVNDDWPGLACTPDFLRLEAKTAGTPNGWEDAAPPKFVTQCQIQCQVMGWDYDWLACLSGGFGGMRLNGPIEVVRDDEWARDVLRPRLEEFWDCVRTGREPVAVERW